MITFTETAREKVLAFMEDFYDDDPALRVAVAEDSSPFAPRYEIFIVEQADLDPEDVLVAGDDFTTAVDPRSAQILQGSVIDFVGAGFEVRNPNVQQLGANAPTGAIAERVQRVIEERINPGVASHGGRIELVDVRATAVFVRMTGGCQGCGLARVTLRQGVERMIREGVPEVSEVVDVTDHVQGANPYYKATT